jgi:hypothetical protein
LARRRILSVKKLVSAPASYPQIARMYADSMVRRRGEAAR